MSAQLSTTACYSCHRPCRPPGAELAPGLPAERVYGAAVGWTCVGLLCPACARLPERAKVFAAVVRRVSPTASFYQAVTTSSGRVVSQRWVADGTTPATVHASTPWRRSSVRTPAAAGERGVDHTAVLGGEMLARRLRRVVPILASLASFVLSWYLIALSLRLLLPAVPSGDLAGGPQGPFLVSFVLTAIALAVTLAMGAAMAVAVAVLVRVRLAGRQRTAVAWSMTRAACRTGQGRSGLDDPDRPFRARH